MPLSAASGSSEDEVPTSQRCIMPLPATYNALSVGLGLFYAKSVHTQHISKFRKKTSCNDGSKHTLTKRGGVPSAELAGLGSRDLHIGWGHPHRRLLDLQWSAVRECTVGLNDCSAVSLDSL